MKTTRVRIVLGDVAPRVMRVLDVPASVTLPELCDLFQVALGWPPTAPYSWHEFVAGGLHYRVPDGLWTSCPGERDGHGVRLGELPDRFVYRYEAGPFGYSGWHHDIDVLGPGGDQPGCVYGEGGWPPRRGDGPSGYYPWLREALADPAHQRHANARDWVGRLCEFDQADTDVWVRRMVGQVPDSVRLVLQLAAEGVKLTPGGRLPRAFVRQVHQQRPNWRYGGAENPALRQDDLPPLVALHHLLRKVGLLRPRHERLAPIRAASDDLEVVRRLRSWFTPGTFSTRVTELLLAVLITSRHGEHSHELADWIQPALGRWVSSDGRAITDLDRHLTITTIELSPVLRGLDLVQHDWTDWGMWRAGPSAKCLLPHVTTMARLWSHRPQAHTEPPHPGPS